MGALIFDWFDKIKRYTRFEKKELKASLISIGVIAFAISFRKWGIADEVDVIYGLINLFGALLIVGVSFFARQSFQKIVSLGADYQAEYKMWSLGLLFTLLLVFVSNGRLWFLIPGGIIIHYMPGNRLGWVRYGLNHFGIGVISLAGPIGNILLAMIWRGLYGIFNLDIFYTAFILNLIWGIWTILPVPPADGVRMYFGSRMVYMFGFAVVISSAILLYFFKNMSVLLIIPMVFAIAWVWWLIYYLVWERFNWKGPY